VTQLPEIFELVRFTMLKLKRHIKACEEHIDGSDMYSKIAEIDVISQVGVVALVFSPKPQSHSGGHHKQPKYK